MTAKKIAKKRGPKPKRHKSPQQIGKAVAQKKDAKLNVAVPKGKKRAATAGRIAERRDQAEMAKLDKKAESKRILKEVLKPLAKEINHRIKQAGELDGKADDHRLAAALQLEAARRQCKEARIKFERWCEKNVEKSYDEIKKLVLVARAPEPAKALADMRSSAATRNRDMRKRQKVSRDVTAPASRAETPWEAADALVSSLPDKEQVNLMSQRAHDIGMALVSETDHNRLRVIDQSDSHPEMVTREEVYRMFLSLKAKDQLALVEEMAKHIGGEFKHDFDADDPGIPASMRRGNDDGKPTANV